LDANYPNSNWQDFASIALTGSRTQRTFVQLRHTSPHPSALRGDFIDRLDPSKIVG